MPVPLAIDDEAYEELKSVAEPLVDDASSLIKKLVAAYKANGSGAVPKTNGSGGLPHIPDFDPTSPPSLTHSIPTKIVLEGKLFKPSQNYWNILLVEVIRLAAEKLPKAKVDELVIVNHTSGKKVGTGFQHVPEADLSVQGQDANNAWKAIFHIVAQLGFKLEVEFKWQAKPEAAFPNGRGRFKV